MVTEVIGRGNDRSWKDIWDQAFLLFILFGAPFFVILL